MKDDPHEKLISRKSKLHLPSPPRPHRVFQHAHLRKYPPPQEQLTYGELLEQSDSLAAFFEANAPKNKPVVVYGHKSPLMLVCFFAALKSGRCYAPIDIAYPSDRINDILKQIGKPLVVSVADTSFAGDKNLADSVIETEEVKKLSLQKLPAPDSSIWVSDNDIFYLLFTSGSTGRPKGVQMPSCCVDAFMRYFRKFVSSNEGFVCFNRVPYTFDVSLFDIIPGLSCGATLFSLEQECETSMAKMFEAFSRSELDVWISTPSFVESCLVDKGFNRQLLPCMKRMVLCGEVLRPSVAKKIIERFPGIELFNTYGPTETQAVSGMLVDSSVVDSFDPLPVGYMNPEIQAHILDPETLTPVPCGETGEIYLSGSTISAGYFGRPDLTENAFRVMQVAQGHETLCYKTGDKGYIDEAGRLFCLGRFDFQVKLNGFRIELGDVESNLNSLECIENSVVVPALKEGKATHLVAHVVLTTRDIPRSFATTQKIRAKLKETVPEYMVPRKIVFHDDFPMNTNGKVDRKAFA